MATGRLPLTRARVLETALRIADEGGVEALSMRRLAKELGVEAMSLYNHVANKDDIVSGIVELVVREIELPDGTDEWRAAVRTYAISAHDVLLRHRWAARLVLSPPGGSPEARATRMRTMEWLLRTLREGGFQPELTYHAYHALDAHILGFTLWQLGHSIPPVEDVRQLAASFLRELPEDEFPYLVEHIHQHLDAPPGDAQREFEFGLDLILDGLERARAAVGRRRVSSAAAPRGSASASRADPRAQARTRGRRRR
jgi:AcrR family transcriptional regulator